MSAEFLQAPNLWTAEELTTNMEILGKHLETAILGLMGSMLPKFEEARVKILTDKLRQNRWEEVAGWGNPYWWNPATNETTHQGEPRPEGLFYDQSVQNIKHRLPALMRYIVSEAQHDAALKSGLENGGGTLKANVPEFVKAANWLSRNGSFIEIDEMSTSLLSTTGEIGMTSYNYLEGCRGGAVLIVISIIFFALCAISPFFAIPGGIILLVGLDACVRYANRG